MASTAIMEKATPSTSAASWLQNGVDQRTDDLYEAIYSGDEVGVDRLIQSGARVDIAGKYGYPPLHLAAMFDHDKIIELLLKKSPTLINSLDNDGSTALHWAVLLGSKKAVAVLLKNGADLHIKDNYGDEPRHDATVLDIVKLLDEEDAKRRYSQWFDC